MTVIEIRDEHAAALTEVAAKQGLTLNEWLEKLAEERAQPKNVKPFETWRGILAPYGPAPSAEEIDENRREMFRNFGQDF